LISVSSTTQESVSSVWTCELRSCVVPYHSVSASVGLHHIVHHQSFPLTLNLAQQLNHHPNPTDPSFVVMGRPGMRVARKKAKVGRVGSPHKVRPENTISWFKQRFDGIVAR